MTEVTLPLQGSVRCFPRIKPMSKCLCQIKYAGDKKVPKVPLLTRVISGQKSIHGAENIPMAIPDFVPVSDRKCPCQIRRILEEFCPTPLIGAYRMWTGNWPKFFQQKKMKRYFTAASFPSTARKRPSYIPPASAGAPHLAQDTNTKKDPSSFKPPQMAKNKKKYVPQPCLAPHWTTMRPG